MATYHSRPQRPRSFWSAPRIATSGQVQRHSGFEWICKHNRLRPEPIKFVRLDSEHAQSDRKSVNRGLPLFDTARGRDSWCRPKGARPLGTRMMLTATLTAHNRSCRREKLVARNPWFLGRWNHIQTNTPFALKVVTRFRNGSVCKAYERSTIYERTFWVNLSRIMLCQRS